MSVGWDDEIDYDDSGYMCLHCDGWHEFGDEGDPCAECGLGCIEHDRVVGHCWKRLPPPELPQYAFPIGPRPATPGWFLLCGAHCKEAASRDPAGDWAPRARKAAVRCDWRGCEAAATCEWFPEKARGTVELDGG